MCLVYMCSSLAASRPVPAELFTTIRTEGGLLPPDLLRRIVAGDRELPGLEPAAYHLSGETLHEAINRAWNRLTGAWTVFVETRGKLLADDPGTSITRERWLLVLFQELGYGRLTLTRPVELLGRTYAVSHLWADTPIHLIGCGVDLDRRTPGVAGAARSSPHSVVQELLNRSEAHRWGFLSNGLLLRILRDNVSLTRQAYVEFDLEAMFDGEVYSDFVLLWLLCQQSRVEAIEGGSSQHDSWLERWMTFAAAQGARVLDGLRDGVKEAIEVLGNGFLAHPSNGALRDALRAGALGSSEYYRQLLRLVYRLIFLFVAEDRQLLLDPGAQVAARERYASFYSTARLRRQAERSRGGQHADIYRSLVLVMRGLGGVEGIPGLGLPALGSFLWSDAAIGALATSDIANRALLGAVRALALTVDGARRRQVDYKNLGTEELGSVYESLLEFHPRLNADAGLFTLEIAPGHERKTTGSYYTPTSLIDLLLDSALEPVIADRIGRLRGDDAERALLSVKVVDPAAGSGHFLVAAAHRMAKHLAAIRTGDEEPAPAQMRRAVRDVIAHCIYAVDVNEMAVELCKISLWLESIEPGRPLSFLDLRIRCGNSLVGATPRLLEGGIPDDAFVALTGDDASIARDLKKRNRQEGSGQLLLGEPLGQADWADLVLRTQELGLLAEETIAQVADKEHRFHELTGSRQYRRTLGLADAWCAVFFQPKRTGVPAITQGAFRAMSARAAGATAQREASAEISQELGFFHWHLEFPEVFTPTVDESSHSAGGWIGGFDVVLGNPPWDQIQLDPQEWFASRDPAIANAPHMSARDKAIKALEVDDPRLFGEYQAAVRRNEAVQHFVHNSGRYPLTSSGRLNSAPLFAETMRLVLSSTGRAGFLAPTGLATDSFTQRFFADLVESNQLVSLYDFENRLGLFPGVHRMFRFALLTLSGEARPSSASQFVFFAHAVGDVADPNRRFELDASDFSLVNPNTKTCPLFRSRRDADLTRSIYRRHHILLRKNPRNPGDDPWGFRGLLMFMMNTASHLFRTLPQLDADGYSRGGNVFRKGHKTMLPLYEGKMVYQFNHRYSDYRDINAASESTQLPPTTPERLADPMDLPVSRYWIDLVEVDKRIPPEWNYQWLIGFRDITNATNERTVISAIIPRTGVGNKLPLALVVASAIEAACLVANLNALVFDYVTRQKLSGTNLNFFILEQLPVLPPTRYAAPAWETGGDIGRWIAARVLELTYSSHDLDAFARDLDYDGAPFPWDVERRRWLRGELDAAFFHLYGLTRAETEFVLDTFPVLRRNEERTLGAYVTRELVLDAFDRLAAVAVS